MDPAPAAPGGGERLAVLDGWRAISILAVMAGHMLPLGPHRWDGNDMVARFGMAVFFALSGFLIVSILWRDQHVGRFLVRRFARIVPLAWLVLGIALTIGRADLSHWAANLFFYANLPPYRLEPYAIHFWSLGVEMQFYGAIALAVALFGRRGLWIVPVAAVAITGLRISQNMMFSLITWFRVDEILAGGCLALVHLGAFGDRPRRLLAKAPVWLLLVVALASAHRQTGALNFARPYVTAAMVGALLYQPQSRWRPFFESRGLAYVARISFALYVFHMFLLEGWFNGGDKLTKYAKRPLTIALSFALAHLSTFHFERYFTRWAHRRLR